VVAFIVLAYLAQRYGDGKNYFQKLLSSLPYFAIVPIVGVILGWFFIGKDRLTALGGPFVKLFKMD
jgi:hypothetical protein